MPISATTNRSKDQQRNEHDHDAPYRLSDIAALPATAKATIFVVESTLDTMRAVTTMILVLVIFVHQEFDAKVKDELIYHSLLLHDYVKRLELRHRTKQQFLQWLVRIRQRYPILYDRLLQVYNKLKSAQIVPQSQMRLAAVGITRMYLRVLFVAMSVLEHISPTLEHLLRLSWQEMYQLMNQTVNLFEHVHAELT